MVIEGSGAPVNVDSAVPFARILALVERADDYFDLELAHPASSATIVVNLSNDVPVESFDFLFAVVDQ